MGFLRSRAASEVPVSVQAVGLPVSRQPAVGELIEHRAGIFGSHHQFVNFPTDGSAAEAGRVRSTGVAAAVFDRCSPLPQSGVAGGQAAPIAAASLGLGGWAGRVTRWAAFRRAAHRASVALHQLPSAWPQTRGCAVWPTARFSLHGRRRLAAGLWRRLVQGAASHPRAPVLELQPPPALQLQPALQPQPQLNEQRQRRRRRQQRPSSRQRKQLQLSLQRKQQLQLSRQAMPLQLQRQRQRQLMLLHLQRLQYRQRRRFRAMLLQQRRLQHVQVPVQVGALASGALVPGRGSLRALPALGGALAPRAEAFSSRRVHPKRCDLRGGSGSAQATGEIPLASTPSRRSQRALSRQLQRRFLERREQQMQSLQRQQQLHKTQHRQQQQRSQRQRRRWRSQEQLESRLVLAQPSPRGRSLCGGGLPSSGALATATVVGPLAELPWVRTGFLSMPALLTLREAEGLEAVIIDPPADGECFYTAIAAARTLAEKGQPEFHGRTWSLADVRGSIRGELLGRQAFYEPFLPQTGAGLLCGPAGRRQELPQTASAPEIIEALMQPGVWANAACVLAAVEAFTLPLLMFDTSPVPAQPAGVGLISLLRPSVLDRMPANLAEPMSEQVSCSMAATIACSPGSRVGRGLSARLVGGARRLSARPSAPASPGRWTEYLPPASSSWQRRCSGGLRTRCLCRPRAGRRGSRRRPLRRRRRRLLRFLRRLTTMRVTASVRRDRAGAGRRRGEVRSRASQASNVT